MATNAFHPIFRDVGTPAFGRARAAVAAVLLLGTAACGGDSSPAGPPEPGNILIATQTTGFLKDVGYEVIMNGQGHGAIGANEQRTLAALEPATYQVSLGDVADNCQAQSGSVTVNPGETASLTLEVTCDADPAANYSIRASRDRPNLENGEIVQCSFGLCPSDAEWDLYVQFDTQKDPQSVIRQNQVTSLEIAHLPGVTLATLTEADLDGATFTAEIVNESLGADRVVLIRTDQGNVYAVGNPVEDVLLMRLTFDAMLVARAGS